MTTESHNIGGVVGAVETADTNIVAALNTVDTSIGNLINTGGSIRFKAQLVNDAGAEVELTGLTANGRYALERLHVVRSAGTAANYRPRVYDSSGVAAGGIADIRYEDSTAVGTPIDNVFTQPIPCQADAAGKLYFQSGVDAGADNTIDYDIYLSTRSKVL